jgi:hypothetical protein
LIAPDELNRRVWQSAALGIDNMAPQDDLLRKQSGGREQEQQNGSPDACHITFLAFVLPERPCALLNYYGSQWRLDCRWSRFRVSYVAKADRNTYL